MFLFPNDQYCPNTIYWIIYLSHTDLKWYQIFTLKLELQSRYTGENYPENSLSQIGDLHSFFCEFISA